MASIKISELNEATSLDSNDLLAMVDNTADETKKVTFGNLETQIINDRFAVVSVASTGESGLIKFNYPSGWTYDNCVVISYSMFLNGVQRTIYPAQSDPNHNNLVQTIVMYPYGIRGIEIGSQVSGATYTIVLMKIA